MKPKKQWSFKKWLVIGASALGSIGFCLSAQAEEATGKVVWVDTKNNAILIECSAGGCAKIPGAKDGETFTFVIPANLMSAVAGLKEGQQVTLTYQAGQGPGYGLIAVK